MIRLTTRFRQGFARTQFLGPLLAFALLTGTLAPSAFARHQPHRPNASAHRTHRSKQTPPATGASAGAQRTTLAAPKPAPFAPTLPAVGVAAWAYMQTWTAANVDRELNDYANLHATWIRHDFAWDSIEPSSGVFNWAGYDQLVTAARARNINVIATISYTPGWANGGQTDHRYAPTSAAQFGQFAGTVAARYAPLGVHVYEIWNEPNIQYWQPTPNPAEYTAALCAAYSAIHAADPQTIVVTGGASPAANTTTTYAPQTWLADLYADGAQNCFDAVGYHPYVDSVATHDDLGMNWYVMYSANGTHNLRTLMTIHGDGAKRIWATEVGCNRVLLGDTECSDRIEQALALWKSYSWAGALCWFTYWDPHVYGLVDGNWNPRPEWYAFQQAASAF